MAQISSKSGSGIDPKSIRIKNHSPTTAESSTQPAGPPAHTQALSTADQQPAEPAGERLLSALWRSRDRIHQLVIQDRQTGRFKHIPVKDVAEAISLANKHSSEGDEVYFACAEYQSSTSRTVANAYGAFGFWLDIDCGEDKAAAGKGYPTPEAVEVALLQFCNDTGLPRPTHIIHSGGGIHAYWALNDVVVRDEWQPYARKLKALTKACEFLADDSRTADIASVLRVPGTLNHKYEPPRPVTLDYAFEERIESSNMLDAITDAYNRLCDTSAAKRSGHASISDTASDDKNVSNYRALDIERLSSALAMLEPDCDEETWKLRRLAPLADAARHYPDYDAELYELARSWSSGELRGEVSMKWITPGSNGLTGAQVFDSVWQRFLTSNYPGVPTRLGTVYHDAILAGWDPDDQFKIITTAAGEEGA